MKLPDVERLRERYAWNAPVLDGAERDDAWAQAGEMIDKLASELARSAL